MSGLRVVAGGLVDPPGALALDEAVVRAAPDAPLLVVWRSRPAVVIGRYQRSDWETDPGACADRGVRVWRRFTGGGAVYLDEGVVCAGLVSPADRPDAGLGVPAMYRPFLEGMARACRALGLEAVCDERTVRVGGRKVTGVAAHRGRTATLVHGTLLVDADLDALRACLAGPRGGDLQGAPRPTMSRPDHVANVGGEAGRAVEAVVEAFGGGDPEPPNAAEARERERLLGERYRDRGWHAGPWWEVISAPAQGVLGG